MTTENNRLASLLEAGYTVAYVPDTVWDGWLFADLLDVYSRRVQCGSAATEAEALADLIRRLDRDGWPENEPEPPDDDDPEGYCTVCGANAGHFISYERPHHFRGEGTAASPVEPFDAGHEPVIAWRVRS